MGDVSPGTNRNSYLHIDEVVDVVRFLIRPGQRQTRPGAFVRTIGNPMAT
jgi:hypothetical protein